MNRLSGSTARVMLSLGLALFALSLWVSCGVLPPTGGHDSLTPLQRAKVYLAAGDSAGGRSLSAGSRGASLGGNLTYLTYL